MRSNRSTAGDQVVDDEHHDRADDSDDHAVEIEAGHPGLAELLEEESADNCTQYAEDDVEYDALAGSIDDLAGDEARDKAQNDPSDDTHDRAPLRCRRH